ncbi:DrmB family protein [Enterococcus sp. LJL98]
MVYKQKDKPEFNVRRSQLLTPFGIGALMDINNQSVMIADSEYWNVNKCEKVHDIRLEKAMDAEGFIEPPFKDEVNVVGKRFPQWYFSPEDRSLRKIDSWRQLVEAKGIPSLVKSFNQKPIDVRKRKTDLVPVRIICACCHGHAQDFPWLEWVHEGMAYDSYENHEITLGSTAQSGSISDLVVSCKRCNKSRNLAGIFDEKRFPRQLEKLGISCKGEYIWKKEESKIKCDEEVHVLLRNANNFFFPNISSSVNIPFKENKLIELIESSEYYSALKSELRGVTREKGIEKLDKDELVNKILARLAEKIEYSFDEVKKLISVNFFNEMSDDYPDTVMDYRRAEFEVLSGKEKYDEDSERFKMKLFNSEDISGHIYSKLLNGITLVHQLEVVSALRSYSRIQTTDSELMKEQALEGKESSGMSQEVSLRRKDNYYVGMRSLGEGIFFSLNSEEIKKWSYRIKDSVISNKIYKKMINIRFSDEENYIHPEYYLIHTLSHLFIKELSMSSGYSSSSLKERIYYSAELGKEMYGILIYTSSSDSEGTLGGLVKQGVPEKFFDLLNAALEKAKWCSFDPVCIESESQGRDSLNGAACHACSLISETSCEKMNVFLDRSVLIGSLEEPELGFFRGGNINDISRFNI